MVLQTINGYPELVLMGACSLEIFYVTSEWLTKRIGIIYTEKSDEGTILRWSFYHSNAVMLLCYDSKKGIVLCPAACAKATDADKAAFERLQMIIQNVM